MSKPEQNQHLSEQETLPEVSKTPENAEQAVENPEISAKTEQETELKSAEAAPQTVVVKRGGKGIALLALLVAVAVGAAGHFLTNRKFAEVEQQMAMLKPVQQLAELPNFDSERIQLENLQKAYEADTARIQTLEQQLLNYEKQISGLKAQVEKLGATSQVEPIIWLLSDADFLLQNALRKMVLENDIETAKVLITEAESVLSEVNSADVAPVLTALKADLAKLNALNDIDQNSLMRRLAYLANLVDEMPLLENDVAENAQDDGNVSDSLADWQTNLEKSANSFLSHFIRVSDKKTATDKAFIAPNQEIYLRENIRLRLQIAILTVPRQQNELYKQSLDAVSTWVRSYFDVQNDYVKTFLTELDELMEKTIYVDAPNRLESLEVLEKLLNKPQKKLEKVQLESDKSLEQLKVDENPEAQTQPAETPAAEMQPSAQ